MVLKSSWWSGRPPHWILSALRHGIALPSWSSSHGHLNTSFMMIKASFPCIIHPKEKLLSWRYIPSQGLEIQQWPADFEQEVVNWSDPDLWVTVSLNVSHHCSILIEFQTSSVQIENKHDKAKCAKLWTIVQFWHFLAILAPLVSSPFYLLVLELGFLLSASLNRVNLEQSATGGLEGRVL